MSTSKAYRRFMLSENRARVTHHPFFLLLAVVAAQCLFFAACTPAPTAPTQYAAYSQTDLIVGSGTEAVVSSTVGVRYTLWLHDSSKSDGKGLQIETTGTASSSFQLSSGVIEGWKRGVPGMRVGGQRRLIVPPELAYGDTRKGAVPPNATLVFDIELVSVQ
jgi:FKBP-type peptidyl-prolyl cis-trans isomerase